MIPLLILNLPCDDAVAALTETLCTADLRTVVSFDSSKVCMGKTAVSPPCPHHGNIPCDCQIVVLLIYGRDKQPATLLAHGQDGKTWVTMAVGAGWRQPALENKITRAASRIRKKEAA